MFLERTLPGPQERSEKTCASCLCNACAKITCCPMHVGEIPVLPQERGCRQKMKVPVKPNRCNVLCSTGKGQNKLRFPLPLKEVFVTDLFGIKVRDGKHEAEHGKSLCPEFEPDGPLQLPVQAELHLSMALLLPGRRL